MADYLSREERALIDAAIEAGKVQQIPAHTASPPQPGIFNPSSKRGPKPDPFVASRRVAARNLAGQGFSVPEIAEKTGRPAKLIRKDLAAAGVRPAKFVPPENVAVAERRAKIRELVEQRIPVKVIVARLGLRSTDVRNDMKFMGLKAPRAPSDPAVPDKARAKRAETVKVGVAKLEAVRERKLVDRRRFQQNIVPLGEPKIVTAKDAKGSIFPSMVRDVIPGQPVLVDGASNAKIGGDVLVGWLKGARIVTLTLEERATCPRSCALWQECYGNALNWSVRWKPGEALERQIEADVVDLLDRFGTVLVRLHITGDFYSMGYLALWARLLEEHPGLAVFGFTAHPDSSPMGAAIAKVRDRDPKRFSIRHSGRSGPWGSVTTPLVEIDAPMVFDIAMCPEQRDAMKGSPNKIHCGACGLCWKGQPTPIGFYLH